MSRPLLLALTIASTVACGEAPDSETFPTVTIPEQSLTWTKCLVGQTHTKGRCRNQPHRLPWCTDQNCTSSPAAEACEALGPTWRLPTFDEYHQLRDRWPIYGHRFDLPEITTAILTSTIKPLYPTWVVAYWLNPKKPKRQPQVLFKQTTPAWVHCVSPSQTSQPPHASPTP